MTVCAASDKFGEFKGLCVESRKFSAAVNRLSGEVDVQQKDASLVLQSAKTCFELEITEPKKTKFVKPSKLYELPLAEIKPLLKFASIAAEPHKAAQTGGIVQLNTVNDLIDEKCTGIEAAGYDGKRCSFSEIVFDQNLKFNYQIPLPVVNALQNFSGEKFQIGETDSTYYLNNSNITIYAHKLNKQFPPYRGYIPKSFLFSATVDSAEFLTALVAIQPLLQDVQEFAADFSFNNGEVVLSTVGSGSKAKSETVYQIDPLGETDEFKIRVNAKLVSDFFNAVKGEVSFGGNGIDKPVFLQAGANKMFIAPIQGGPK
jgi:DNA polymerase III sliding clamp (beta) subunit (PCNA family)